MEASNTAGRTIIPTRRVPGEVTLPADGGVMGLAVRSFDWASTPLGPMATWPQSLRVAVGICLHSRFPMFVWWGSKLINIYNDAYIPVLGKRHPDALGQPAREIWGEIWDVIGPQADAVMLRGEATWNERAPLLMERNGFTEQTFFNWSYSPICAEKGEVLGLFCACTEETQRVLAEDALRESEARFRQLADAMPQIVWTAGPDGNLDYYNRRWFEYIDVPEYALDRATWDRFIHPADLQRVYEAWSASVRSGDAYQIEFRVRRADGKFRWFLVRAVAVKDEQGQIIRWLGTCTDIHDEKQLQGRNEELLESERAARSEAERASQMKDEFLATLSHELRTPLNAILGWAQILRAGPADAEDLREGLDTIERNARAQTQIIEDLLDMSRIINGKVRLDVQRIDLAVIVHAAVNTVKPAADAKGIRIQTILDARTGPISGDPNRLQQIFWNLLSNAVKFTPKDGRVQVVLERVDSHVEVRIIDTGEGIKPEFIPHVFGRFRQADATTTRRHGGLGLGLAIVKQLSELHGGTVRVSSAGVGQGATFIVSLPLISIHVEPSEAENARRHPQLAQTSIPHGECAELTGLKVLVVDDEADARGLVRRLLEDCGATVIVAASASEGYWMLQSERPDILVSDIGMPGEDGYSLIRRVRALETEKGGNTPAVALTAYARAEDRMKAVVAGFQHHVVKPVEPAELITMVASLAKRGEL